MPDETHQWFIYRGPNFREGPFSPQDLRDSIRGGFLKPDDLLWRDGMRAPEKARHLDGLFGELVQQWFIYRGPNLREGPYSQHDIRASVRKGSLKLDDLLWREGMAAPEKARHLSELFGDVTQHWFIYRGPNLREGPYSTQDIRDSVSKGLVRPDDLLWREGMPAPEKARHLSGLFSSDDQETFGSRDRLGFESSRDAHHSPAGHFTVNNTPDGPVEGPTASMQNKKCWLVAPRGKSIGAFSTASVVDLFRRQLISSSDIIRDSETNACWHAELWMGIYASASTTLPPAHPADGSGYSSTQRIGRWRVANKSGLVGSFTTSEIVAFMRDGRFWASDCIRDNETNAMWAAHAWALVYASNAIASLVEASSPVAQPVFTSEYASRPAESTSPAPASDAAVAVVEKKSNPIALAGFCLGVTSVLLPSFGIIPLLGMAVSAVGLVTFDGSRHGNKWQARWGLGLSVVYMLVNMYLNGHFGGYISR
jgi:hypothetical protein